MLKPGKIALSDRQFLLWLLVGYGTVNFLMLGLAWRWNLERPIFNLDYLLVVLVYVWFSRTLAAVALTGFMLVDLARMLIPAFFFTTQAFSITFWLRAIGSWPLEVLLLAAVVVVGLAAGAVWFFRRYQLTRSNRRLATLLALCTLLVLVLADWLNGTSSRARRDANWLSVNLAGSPAYLIGLTTTTTLSGTPATFEPLPLEQSATGRYVLGWLNSPPTNRVYLAALLNQVPLPTKIVLVVAESLSVRRDDPELTRWRRPFLALTNRYELDSGTLAWTGSTQRGELRELCWAAKDGVNVSVVPDAWPGVLAANGYDAVALHGFLSGMYERDRIGPLLGFTRLRFLEDLRGELREPLAGTLFSGARDSDMARLVETELRRPGRRFIYWLTLSGHIPVDMRYAREIATPAELAERTAPVPAVVWAHTVICEHLLEAVAELAGDAVVTDCDFIIVGDHPVPMRDGQAAACFEPGRVPFVILRHRAVSGR